MQLLKILQNNKPCRIHLAFSKQLTTRFHAILNLFRNNTIIRSKNNPHRVSLHTINPRLDFLIKHHQSLINNRFNSHHRFSNPNPNPLNLYLLRRLVYNITRYIILQSSICWYRPDPVHMHMKNNIRSDHALCSDQNTTIAYNQNYVNKQYHYTLITHSSNHTRSQYYISKSISM